MKSIYSLCAAILMLAISISLSLAAETLSAPEALKRAEAGQLVLVDIRQPDEWKQSGIASLAVPLSMQDRGFLDGLSKIRSDNPGKEIAIICATGGRSAYLQRELEKRGLGSVIDVSEGMFGNGREAGWIKRGLPMKQVQ